MEHPIVPTRITIDFRDSIDPRRGWIVGVGDGRSRVELLAIQRDEAPPARDHDGVASETLETQRALPLRALDDGCTCPEFCERDHANE